MSVPPGGTAANSNNCDNDTEIPSATTVSDVLTNHTGDNCTSNSKSNDMILLIGKCLEEQLLKQSNELEENHFEAALNAKIAISSQEENDDGYCQPQQQPIVLHNCYSPYVPSKVQSIHAMLQMVLQQQQQALREEFVFCDFGCGDGRVCYIVTSYLMMMNTATTTTATTSTATRVPNPSLSSFRTIGIDVSPECIDVANKLKTMQLHSLLPQQQQQMMMMTDVSAIADQYMTFHTADLTAPIPDLLYDSNNKEEHNGSSPTSLLGSDLLSTTVIYLYTYPTLLQQLRSLLAYLFLHGKLRYVVTLTYHLHHHPQIINNHSNNNNNNSQPNNSSDKLMESSAPPDFTYDIAQFSKEHDLCLYTNIVKV